MRRALLAAFAGIIWAASAAALDVPYLSGRITDNAHLLDAGSANALELKLKDYETRTGRQFAVLTIPSLQGAVLEEYSLNVARTWKLGRKGKDDGILLLVSRDDRKLRIEVGYGLEGVLPDALCGRVIRDAIVPRFRGGDYAGGVTAGVDAVLAALSGSPSSPDPRGSHRPLQFADVFLALVFVLMLVQDAFASIFSLSPGAGLLQFLFMNFMVSMLASDWWSLMTGVILFIFNSMLLAVLTWVASNTDWGRQRAKEAVQKGTAMYWLSTSSGSSGGSSGGGFSGGGGSFGGGGSSGSW